MRATCICDMFAYNYPKAIKNGGVIGDQSTSAYVVRRLIEFTNKMLNLSTYSVVSLFNYKLREK